VGLLEIDTISIAKYACCRIQLHAQATAEMVKNTSRSHGHTISIFIAYNASFYHCRQAVALAGKSAEHSG
jgi:hypothetical protein